MKTNILLHWIKVNVFRVKPKKSVWFKSLLYRERVSREGYVKSADSKYGIRYELVEGETRNTIWFEFGCTETLEGILDYVRHEKMLKEEGLWK